MPSLLYFSSSIFLGWSLGANDAANNFGTAVGTKMIRFQTAAFICCIFVILGAVISGAGTTETLGNLGAVNALPGAFVVAMAAAITITWMTKIAIPTSTSQAIVGAIIGWNLFAGYQTDLIVLRKIVSTWLVSPLLAAVFAFILFFLIKLIIENVKINIFTLDRYTRIALLVAGAFGAYSLGANNIANVMGVFVVSSPFRDLNFSSLVTISGTQQLFFVGGVAISLGVISYSKRVMQTVGSGLYNLSPITAVVVVLASSLVLFIFASEGLRALLIGAGLPSLPLVPVSQSQSVVGSIIGVSIAKGAGRINYKLFGSIGIGWVLTPICSALFSYMLLIFMQNIFMQTVYM